MTFGRFGMKHPSLAGMADSIKGKISRIGLHFRFNKAAFEFLKECLSFLLKQIISKNFKIKIETLKHIKRILILDSSSWDICEKLQDIFAGSGGSASKANCKLQLYYDFLTGKISFWELVPGKRSDQGYSSFIINQINKNDLIITDLGYFCLKTIYSISKKGAFYLSRLLIGTTVFDPLTEKPINLIKLLKQQKDDIIEMEVLMGASLKDKIHCRLIILKVNKKIAKKRKEDLKKKAKKNKRKSSQIHLQLTGWTFIVTNIPKLYLPKEMARTFYTIRWQIELIFKQMKSIIEIHKSNTSKEYRLKCEIIGSLIIAVFVHKIHGHINAKLWNTQRKELSMEKFYKRFQERAFTLHSFIIKSVNNAVNYLIKQFQCFLKNCLKYRQHSRKSTLESLMPIF